MVKIVKTIIVRYEFFIVTKIYVVLNITFGLEYDGNRAMNTFFRRKCALFLLGFLVVNVFSLSLLYKKIEIKFSSSKYVTILFIP